MDRIWILFCGFCMGAADLVPGVSGGTIAFILGIYDDLIDSLRRFKLPFLVILVTGMAFAILLLAPKLSSLLNDPSGRIILFAGFFGLIIGSTWYCSKLIKNWKMTHIIFLLFGIFCSAGLTFWKAAPGSYDVVVSKNNIRLDAVLPVNYDPSTGVLKGVNQGVLKAMVARGIISLDTVVIEKNRGRVLTAADIFKGKSYTSYLDIWIVFCGSLAISAMLLPGISGSYILMVLGVYPVVIGALAQFVVGLKNGVVAFDSLSILLNLLLGIAIGALLFSRFVGWLLEKYHSLTVALLIGFMVGALRSVWPFWNHQWVLHPLRLEHGPLLEVTTPFFPEASMISLAALLVAFASCLLIVFIERIAIHQLHQDKALGRSRKSS